VNFQSTPGGVFKFSIPPRCAPAHNIVNSIGPCASGAVIAAALACPSVNLAADVVIAIGLALGVRAPRPPSRASYAAWSSINGLSLISSVHAGADANRTGS
jgi:hypothetical protein